MNLSGLRILIQSFSTRIWLAQQVRNIRSHSIRLPNFAPISGHCGTRVFETLEDTPLTTHATIRYYGDQPATKNKFEPGQIESRLMATYDDIVALPKHPEVLLIDVRQPKELAATGTIPTGINIPLKFVGEELQLSPKVFEAKYGRAKPTADSPLIFCCRIGVRSGQAANIAAQLGFTNRFSTNPYDRRRLATWCVKNYVGSWAEYAEKNNLPQ